MKFSEMKYIRPDINEIRKCFNDLNSSFTNAKDFAEAEKAMNEIVNISKEYDSMYCLNYLKFNCNTKNEENAAEKEFFDNNGPAFYNLYNEFYKSLLNSKFKDDITKKYGKQILNIAESSLKASSPEVVQSQIEENLLCSEYDILTASGKSFFDGKEMNLQKIVPFLFSTDREVRKRACEAYWKFFADNSDKYDEIFTKLVKLRNDMGLKLGYKNFVGLGYALLKRTDYDSKMVSGFRENILKYFLPVVTKLRERKRKRLGLDKVMFYDNPIQFKSGNAKPKGGPDEIVKQGRKMYEELSPGTKEFFDFMFNNELMDLKIQDGKTAGGFCSFIHKYKSPFIFANMNGTSSDVDILTHEAGHAYQVFMSRDLYFAEYISPTMESAEIFSRGMEFFTYPWMELFFKEDTDKFKFSHLSSLISGFLYQSMGDEFQEWIYEHPEVEPNERSKKWKELVKKYLPFSNTESIPFIEEGNQWKDSVHIFQAPFYLIDYALASICALQFWSKSIKNETGNYEEAWNDYVKICKLGGSKSFLELLKEANLESPFNEDVIKKLAEEVDEYLESIDDMKFN